VCVYNCRDFGGGGSDGLGGEEWSGSRGHDGAGNISKEMVWNLTHLHPDTQRRLRNSCGIYGRKCKSGEPPGVGHSEGAGGGEGKGGGGRGEVDVEEMDLEGQVPLLLEIPEEVWRRGLYIYIYMCGCVGVYI
jgi:hypothetical protein